jgi:starch-binding outer membrane protein, SusD/RagB family
MKKIIPILLVALCFSSCKKFLELYPEHQISTATFYTKQTDFENALVGAYSTIRDLYGNSNAHHVSELGTDNAEINWSSPTVDQMQFDQSAVTPTNGVIRNIWTTCLFTVARCNLILQRIDAVDFDAAAKQKIKAETQFLRAFSFFQLVQYFGNIPITDAEFNSPEEIMAADLTLKPKEEAYAVIIADLLAAEAGMPVAAPGDKTRASIGTIKTLLGKVYLTRQEWNKAELKLKEVIDLKHYSIVPNYRTLFNTGNNNTAESIFEIQFVTGRTLGNNFSALFTPAITSMAIFPNNLQGSGRIVPTLDLMNAYESGDSRKALSVSDSVRLINGTKAYSRYGLKFVDFTTTATSDGTVAFLVLRYADVLLMYAEALNEQGKPLDAIAAVTPIRTRAGLGALPGNNQGSVRLALERERRVELSYEGHRWFDLVRTNRLKPVMDAHYTAQNLSFRVEPYEYIMPIPQNEIDLNPALQQNAGY